MRTTVYTEEVIDYAKPTHDAEVALKQLHFAYLAHDLGKAKQMALLAMVKAAEAYKALEHDEQMAIGS